MKQIISIDKKELLEALTYKYGDEAEDITVIVNLTDTSNRKARIEINQKHGEEITWSLNYE